MADGDGEDDDDGDRKGGRKGGTARELYIYDEVKPAKESRRSWQEEKEGIACSFGCKKCFHMLPGSFWLVPGDVALDSKDRICWGRGSVRWLPPLCFMQGGSSCLPASGHHSLALHGNIVQR